MVLQKTLESSLDCKEIQPVYPKGDQSWVFIGRTDAEAETPNLWPTDARTDSFEKTLMLGQTVEATADFIFLDSKITADGDCSHEIKRCLLLGKQRHYFANKGPSGQGYGFPSGHVWM